MRDSAMTVLHTVTRNVLLLLVVICTLDVSSAKSSAPRRGYPRCWTAGISADGRTNDVGDLATIMCESKGGNPPASLQWTVGGTVVSPSSAQVTDSRTQKTTNTLTWSITADQDGAYGTCTSTHPVSGTATCTVGPIAVSGGSGRDLERNNRLLDALMELLDEETED